MLSLWQMARGRLVAGIVAGIMIFLGWLGFGEISGEDVDTITALASAFVNFLGFVSYGLYHLWTTKRKLQRGEVAQENLEKLRI